MVPEKILKKWCELYGVTLKSIDGKWFVYEKEAWDVVEHKKINDAVAEIMAGVLLARTTTETEISDLMDEAIAYKNTVKKGSE